MRLVTAPAWRPAHRRPRGLAWLAAALMALAGALVLQAASPILGASAALALLALVLVLAVIWPLT